MLFSALKLIKMFVKLCKRLKLLSTAGGVRNSGHNGDVGATSSRRQNTVLCQINNFLDSLFAYTKQGHNQDLCRGSKKID